MGPVPSPLSDALSIGFGRPSSTRAGEREILAAGGGGDMCPGDLGESEQAGFH